MTTALGRRLLILLGLTAAAALVTGAAWAEWTEDGDGDGIALTGSLTPASAVSASTTPNTDYVTLSWTGGSTDFGRPVDGYVVRRVDEADQTSAAACGTSASAPVTGNGCTDTGVTDGNYHYVVTTVLGSWTAEASVSNSVEVINDTSLPTVAVTSISPTPNGNGYNNTSPVTLQLTAHAGAGIASITYQVDNAAAVTVNASTTTVSVSGEATHTVTYKATDEDGNVSETKTQTIRIDTTAPAAPSAPKLTAATDTGASSTDGITKNTAPAVTGTTEANATVIVYDGGTQVGTGAADSAGFYTLSVGTLSAGTHTLTARSRDTADNLGPLSASSQIVVDTTAPTAAPAPTLTAASDSGVSNNDRITNVVKPTFTGTAEAGATITLYNSTTAVGTATVAADGTFSVTATTALAAGSRSMTVKVTDLAGNLSSSSASTVVTIDTTAPSRPGTPVLAAASDSGRLANDKITNVTAPTISGTMTASTTDTYLTVYDGSTTIGNYVSTGSSWSIVSSTLADGVHTITAKTMDLAGNLSTASTSIAVTVDTIAPAAPSAPALGSGMDTGRSSTDRVTNKPTPTITGTNESKAIVVLYDGSQSVGSVTTTSTTSSIVSSTLADGAHTLTATATDVAGNLGPASSATAITIDTVAPDAPSTPALAAASDTGVSSNDGITKTTVSLAFSGTAEPNSLVGLYDTSTATGSQGTTAAGGAWSTTTSTTALVSGAHAINAKATDVAGNVSAASGSAAITIDTAAPTVTVNQSADQADPTTTASVSFSVAFSEAVYGFDSTDVTIGGTAGATTATVSGSGPTYTVTVTGMTKSGTVTLAIAAIKVTDAAGNNNTASTATDNSVTYTDNVAPVAPSTPTLSAASDTGVSNSDNITKTTTPVFTGTAEAGATVKLYDGSTQVGSGTATGGSWSITSSTLANGVHSLTATATDPSGNVGPASSATSVAIDTVAPTVTVNQAAGQADPTTGSSIAFTAVFNETVYGIDSTKVTLGGTAGATSVAVSGAGPTYTLTATGMVKSGTVTAAIAAAKVTDAAGNNNAASTSTDQTVTYNDTVAPSVAISSFAAGSGQTAVVSGTGGTGGGDLGSVTVVLCGVSTYPCASPKATLTGTINPDGTWTVTSAALGSTSQLYARATQADQQGNTGTSAVVGPISIL